MKIKFKDITHRSIAKTIQATLACLMATTAFALDDRFGEPGSGGDKDEPEVPEKLPDLVPLGIKSVYDETDQYFHHYSATVTVANFGKAASGKFHCAVGFKVLGTTDSKSWPVGSNGYGGIFYFDGLKPLDIADKTDEIGFLTPTCATKVEIFLVVDHVWDWDSLWDKVCWEGDFGKDLIGDIIESKENNNVLGGYIMDFEDYTKYDPNKAFEDLDVSVIPNATVHRK